ncbi:MAG: class I SAM-dependent methyltransferase [Acidobacteria bacterium]|nr:MAG: class I SAM-dependent methyltransferase [Acidobacteriota bacterium]
MSNCSLNNTDAATVAGFGREWTRFTQEVLSPEEGKEIFQQYFSIFPWDALPKDGGCGADIGCGSGRWARAVAPRVRELHLVDASSGALKVARTNLSSLPNVRFHHASAGDLPFEKQSLDFAYSLGVLHHIPDPEGGLRSIASALKPGAPLLLYLYYAFDNRPAWYRGLWRLSDLVRRALSRQPQWVKVTMAEMVALWIYWPLARMGALFARFGAKIQNWPLAYYRDRSFYVMRTDALDRLGTQLEQRFTRIQIAGMLERAGFEKVRFSEGPPFWCAVGLRDVES